MATKKENEMIKLSKENCKGSCRWYWRTLKWSRYINILLTYEKNAKRWNYKKVLEDAEARQKATDYENAIVKAENENLKQVIDMSKFEYTKNLIDI